MIYIDPPYNTGHDFVYNDDFKEGAEEYLENSGQFDDEGNRLFQNTESNGRFHTDWLNMLSPRLKIARDLLSDDGVIFISIDDNEVGNLLKICYEAFGENFVVSTIPWRKRTAKSDVPFGVSQDYEWIVCCAKSNGFLAGIGGKERRYYETEDFPNKPWRVHDLTKQTTAAERPNSYFTIVNPKTGEEYPANPNATWRITEDTIHTYLQDNRIVFPGDYPFLKISKPVLRYWKEDDKKKAGERFGKVALSTKLPERIGMSQDGTREISDLFSGKIYGFPKPTGLISYLIEASTNDNDIIMDFFSGSGTTAHAVMQMNAKDEGNRKFIMVQLPEPCDEKSEAHKAGYKNICEIGKERIRRAGKRIKEETASGIATDFQLNRGNAVEFIDDAEAEYTKEVQDNLDIGFRVLKLDSTNMKDVYYNPHDVQMSILDSLESNIKEDRTPEDLLFQVMLDLGILLSSKIEESEIAGKKVFNVADNFLIACFDDDVTEETITAVAKSQPAYFVMRDSSMKNDSVATNFDQIFATYSPDTVRKVI